MKPVIRIKGSLIKGKLIDRPNRFTLTVNVDGNVVNAYLANPGKLSTVLERGRDVLLLRPKKGKRELALDVFAVKLKGFYVMVISRLANRLFEAMVERGLHEGFRGYEIAEREKSMEGYGRLDFLLKRGGKSAYVEVKSCTHVEDGVAKFPDRPTERGRRHLRKLIDLTKGGDECHVVFVVQRPDAKGFAPFEEVDPEFARLFRLARDSGVKLTALSVEFEPITKTVYLVESSLPILIDCKPR
jgi:sugar fermentation stimulation protein A